MITWNIFIYFAIPALVLWAAGAWMAWRERRVAALASTIAGTIVFAAFIVGLWISLERPPLRSMGETRLWYSFFMPVAGIITYSRWRYKWLLSFSTLMALVFICINLFKPEIHNKTLMPALQSPWFAPHVIVYMFSYAMMGAATLMALWMIVKRSRFVADSRFAKFAQDSDHQREIELTDNLVNVGIVFITIGMLFGAIWAKAAWGHYWSWDPKETWAAATWALYLVYLHMPWHQQASDKQQQNNQTTKQLNNQTTKQQNDQTTKQPNDRTKLWLLVIAFCCLQMCWWGINYLPSAQGNSVHTYNLN